AGRCRRDVYHLLHRGRGGRQGCPHGRSGPRIFPHLLALHPRGLCEVPQRSDHKCRQSESSGPRGDAMPISTMNIAGDHTNLIRFQVAEKLGWHDMEYSRDGLLVGRALGRKVQQPVPSYALDIKAVWEIVEWLTRRRIRVNITNESVPGAVQVYKAVIGPED